MQHDEYVDYVNGSPRRRADYTEANFSSWSGAGVFDWQAAVDALLGDDE